MILALLISRLDVGFVFFKWVALVFCPRRPRGLVRASSGALVWKHVICGCCRVTSQKRLSYRLQALSSLFFAVMPSILRIRLDGWFSRCRGQSSGKSASRQRSYERYSRDVQERQAMFEGCSREASHVRGMFKRGKPCSRDVQERQAMFEGCSRDVQERQAMFEGCSRELRHVQEDSFATGALFKTVQLGPARGRLVESDCPYGAEPRPCPGLLGWTKSSVISHALLGSITLPIFIHV